MRTQLRSKEKAVLEATLHLVNNRGFHASSMAKIAQTAGISPGTIYLYFKNKQDMLDRLYIFIKSEMCQSAFQHHQIDGAVVSEFKTIWYGIADYKLQHIEEAMFLSNCDISPVVTAESKQTALTHLRPLMDLCLRGQAEGILRPVPLELIYAFSIHPLSLLIAERVQNNLPITSALIDKAFEMAWKAISL